MRPARVLLATVLTGFLAAGCLPVASRSPLGSTAPPQTDRKLTGTWNGRFGASDRISTITFYPPRAFAMRVVLVAPGGTQDRGSRMVFEARSVKLGNNSYLDVREIEDRGKPAERKIAHVPVLYSLTGDRRLSLYLIDERAARQAIAQRRIAGAVGAGQFGDVTITASPAALDTYFASAAGRALFKKPLGVFRRRR